MSKYLFQVLSITVIGIIKTNSALTIGSTLAQCQAIALQFKNTCTGAPSVAADWNNFAGAKVGSCTQQSCPDGKSSPCSWTRKLCVTCQEINSMVYIRVQTNGLPDHCFMTPAAVSSQKYDFTVKFNPSTAGQTLKSFTDQADYDSQVCTVYKTNTVPSYAGYMPTTGISGINPMNTLAGVAVNGVAILGSSSAEKVDPFYPTKWSGSSNTMAEMVDACLGHPQIAGIYHYHILAPCIKSTVGISVNQPCARVSNCISNIKDYALSGYANYKEETLLGIAKDGHMILGPYNSNGQQFNCSQTDQCGGTKSNDNSYVYIFSNKFPYTMDCFGPAQTLTYQASCSSNTCQGSPTTSFAKISFQLLKTLSLFALVLTTILL